MHTHNNIIYRLDYSSLLPIITLSTMNTFGVSLFQQPQQFVAAKLALEQHKPGFLQFLASCLARSKSPPLALTYTHLFLQPQSEEQLSLNLIRFVSQLADVSPGVSMSGSLHNILEESAFLTELRHNLTHKTMVKGSILILAKNMVLEELQEKYWKSTCEKVVATYRLDPAHIQYHYNLICGQSYEGDLSVFVGRHELEYFKECSNYEFKEHILTVIKDFRRCRVTADSMWRHYREVSASKQVIFAVVVFREYLEGEGQEEHFTHFVIKFAGTLSQDILSSEVVRRELLKAYFLRYLSHADKIVQSLPQKTREELGEYYRSRGVRLFGDDMQDDSR